MKKTIEQKIDGLRAAIAAALVATCALPAANAALIHYYNFDDGTANDSVGTADGIVISDATLGVDGISGLGIFFKGERDSRMEIDVDLAETMNVNENGTIMFWFNTADDRNLANTESISGWAFHEGDDPGGGVFHGKQGSSGSSSLLIPEIFDEQPSQNLADGSGFPILSFGTWHHVAIARDQNDGARLTVYVNGQILDDTQHSPIVLQAAGKDLGYSWVLGSTDQDSNRTWHGTIDELRIYDDYLTLQQIQAIVAEFQGQYPFTEVQSGNTTGFQFQSAVGSNYVLQVSNAVSVVFLNSGASIVGDGSMQTLYDPSGFDPAADYQILEQ